MSVLVGTKTVVKASNAADTTLIPTGESVVILGIWVATLASVDIMNISEITSDRVLFNFTVLSTTTNCMTTPFLLEKVGLDFTSAVSNVNTTVTVLYRPV